MPAPNLMDPAHELALYNPNTYVRGSAVEAVGKFYGVKAMKKAKSDEVNAKARVQQYASMDPLPYSPIVLSDEEEMAFDELIEHNDEEEPAEEGGEGEPTGLAEGEEEGHDLAVGAAAVGKMTVEKMTKEETAEVEKKGKKPFGATTSEKARKEKSEKVPSVGTPTVEMKEKGPVTSTTTDATPSNKPARPQQKEKKKQQMMPASGTTAWYLQRGKELDRKRT